MSRPAIVAANAEQLIREGGVHNTKRLSPNFPVDPANDTPFTLGLSARVNSRSVRFVGTVTVVDVHHDRDCPAGRPCFSPVDHCDCQHVDGQCCQCERVYPADPCCMCSGMRCHADAEPDRWHWIVVAQRRHTPRGGRRWA